MKDATDAAPVIKVHLFIGKGTGDLEAGSPLAKLDRLADSPAIPARFQA